MMSATLTLALTTAALALMTMAVAVLRAERGRQDAAPTITKIKRTI